VLINSSSERFGYIAEGYFATELIANPDSKNAHAAKRYSTVGVCLTRAQTFSTQSALIGRCGWSPICGGSVGKEERRKSKAKPSAYCGVRPKDGGFRMSLPCVRKEDAVTEAKQSIDRVLRNYRRDTGFAL
jgi:hypothetical protein